MLQPKWQYTNPMFSPFVPLKIKTIHLFTLFFEQIFLLCQKIISDGISELYSLYTTYIKNSLHELEQYYLLLRIYIGDFRLLWPWFLNVFLIEKYCTFCIFCIFFHQSFILHFLSSTTHKIFYYLSKRTILLSPL